MLAHVARTGDRRALVLSDFMTRRELHRTDLYAEVYRRIPMEYQLAMGLRSPLQPSGRSPEVVGLSLGRIRRDFTRAERRLLETLQPHLSSTLDRLHELALLRATIAADPQSSSRWVVLDDGTTVAWASPAAMDGLGVTAGAPLPAALRSWLGLHREGRDGTTTITVGNVRLRPRLVAGAYSTLDAVHLTPLTDSVPAQALRSLGLTRRQADVLALALQGRAAAEIADTLALSRRTVEKHFEAIYARLGAANRSEAIVTALQAVGANFGAGGQPYDTGSPKFAAQPSASRK
jgi:DNA-binding CsgD family transcriptional regulator